MQDFNRALIKRIAVIDREIGEKRFPTKEKLSKLLEVSSKTVQRDIEFMRFEFNAPIDFDRIRRGYIYSDKNFRLRPFKIESSDLLAVAVTEKVLKQYEGTPYVDYFKKFFNKISGVLDDKVLVDVKNLSRLISFNPGPVREVNPDIMAKVRKAVMESIRVKVLYETAYSGAKSERLIDIYHLLNHRGDWYFVGFCRKTNSEKVFAVSRIKRIKLTNIYFDKPENFSPEKYFEDSFGIFKSEKMETVRIRVCNDAVRYVSEKKWHKSQKIIKQRDGSILVEYRLNNLTDFFYWVLTLGRDCTVLKPKSLRDDVVNELKLMMKNYR